MKTHGFIYLFIGLVSCLGLLLAFVWGIEVGFSVSQDEYERNIIPVLSVLGTWVGAFATCSAVLLSLWLAFRQINQDKEILDCRLDMNLIPGIKMSHVSVLLLYPKAISPQTSCLYHGLVRVLKPQSGLHVSTSTVKRCQKYYLTASK